jgi:hypothetical protein
MLSSQHAAEGPAICMCSTHLLGLQIVYQTRWYDIGNTIFDADRLYETSGVMQLLPIDIHILQKHYGSNGTEVLPSGQDIFLVLEILLRLSDSLEVIAVLMDIERH